MSRSPEPSDVIESYLLGVLTDPPRQEVSFMFRSPGGEHEFSLRARGVEDMLIDDFLHQNIVHEVRILGKDSNPQDVRDLLAYLLFGRAAASEVVEPTFLVKLDESTVAVLEERKVLLEVEPVYGASVLLLAGSVEWLESNGPSRANPFETT